MKSHRDRDEAKRLSSLYRVKVLAKSNVIADRQQEMNQAY